MEKKQITIRIPRSDEGEVAKLSQGSLGKVNKKFEKMEQLLWGVLVAVVLAMVSIIISVTGLFLDQMRFNNAAYREYSQKTEAIELNQKTNEALLKQVLELSERNRQLQMITNQLPE